MANRFFGRLLGTPSASPEVAEAVAALDALAQARPALQTAAAILRSIFPRLFEQGRGEFSATLTPDRARAKLAEGIPLLRGETVTPDRKGLRRCWLDVCAALAEHQDAAPVRSLAAAVRRGALVPAELIGAILAGRAEEVPARAEMLGLDAALTATVLRLACYAGLTRLAAGLAPLRETAAWEQGYCPTCGSWPLFGEYRGLDQARVLRCGLCATAWPFSRLRCAFCDNGDHRRLGYLHAEGEQDRYRAATCEACRGYVKMASTLAPLSAALLLVTDLATLHLDLAAADRGYFVP